MYDRQTSFDYFHRVLDEIKEIISINNKANNPEDIKKILLIIDTLLSHYNTKNGVRLSTMYSEDSGLLDFYLSENVYMRGYKKLFKTTISIKMNLRKANINKLINKLMKKD